MDYRMIDGMFQGSNVRVRATGSDDPRLSSEPRRYFVEAEGYIELDTSSIEVANGIAAALQATVPAGHRYDRIGALWSLSQLVAARRLLADLIESQADVLGEVGQRMREVARKIYGDRSRL